MQDQELYFVIPTCRLREAGETVEHYDDTFGATVMRCR